MADSTAIFTAAQIAAALGTAKRHVRRRLANVAPGVVMVAGNAANAWPLAALPPAWREELAARAQRGGYRSADELLASPPTWSPPAALSEITEEELHRAAQLQRALAPALTREGNLELSESEFERLGIADYCREVGHAITPRYWRKLFRRTKERDAGAEQFTRLELYLPERPARKRAAGPRVTQAAEQDFAELLEVIATFGNAASPIEAEMRLLWLRAFEVFEQQTAAGKSARKVKARLFKFLLRHAPFMARNTDALRVSFSRKHARWVAAGRDANALADTRGKKSGHHRAPGLVEDDLDKIKAKAVLETGGNVSQAFRELSQAGELSEALLGHYQANPARKSYVPARIREAVRHEVAQLEDLHHGPRRAKLNGAHLDRDWSKVMAMDWLCADDATLDLYYYVPDGRGWFTLMRGQFLLMIDSRTTRILGYALLHSRNYNAHAIRTLITRTCDEHGLPRRGLYFERGIWKNSKLLKGDESAPPFSWGEAEMGLREFGLDFVHSNLPRSKPVERVLGAFQSYLKGDPGYCGNDEVHNGFERLKKLQLAVAAKRVDPREHFYGEEQWLARLDEICARYNADPQGGKLLNGLSPEDAFELMRDPNDPPVRFGASCRYLLAHHKRPVKVTGNGLTLRFGKQSFNYRDAQTGRLVGQTVLAWFNPECPEILAVTDLERGNPFCVARSQSVPAMDAPPELLAQEMARIEAHQSFAKVRYRTLKAKFAPKFRPNLVGADVLETGRVIGEQTAAVESAQKERRQLATRARNAEQKLGVRLPGAAANRPESVAAAADFAAMVESARADREPPTNKTP